MSSGKLLFYRIAVLSLLLVDIVLCYFVIKTVRSNTPRYDVFRDYLYDYCLNTSSIEIKEIKETIEQKLHSSYNDQYSVICFFIPPYPCGACVDKELSIFLKNDSMSQRMVIISPNNYYRDIRAKTNGEANIIKYDVEAFSDSPLNTFNGVIYIHLTYGIVDDVFLSNEWVSEASVNFIKMH